MLGLGFMAILKKVLLACRTNIVTPNGVLNKYHLRFHLKWSILVVEVFSELSRFQKPWHFRFGSALNQPLNGRKPSAALNTFRLAVSQFSQNDVEKYFILRSLPPTIRTLLCGNTSLQTADEMAKAADEAMTNFETGTSHQFISNSLNTLHLEKDMCFFHKKFGEKARYCKKGCLYFDSFQQPLSKTFKNTKNGLDQGNGR